MKCEVHSSLIPNQWVANLFLVQIDALDLRLGLRQRRQRRKRDSGAGGSRRRDSRLWRKRRGRRRRSGRVVVVRQVDALHLVRGVNRRRRPPVGRAGSVGRGVGGGAIPGERFSGRGQRGRRLGLLVVLRHRAPRAILLQDYLVLVFGQVIRLQHLLQVSRS